MQPNVPEGAVPIPSHPLPLPARPFHGQGGLEIPLCSWLGRLGDSALIMVRTAWRFRLAHGFGRSGDSDGRLSVFDARP
jgi:hypothetical protein